MGNPFNETRITLSAFLNGSVKDVFVTDQKSKAFIVSDGTETFRVHLTNKDVPELEGEAVLLVTPHNAPRERARLVQEDTVKTFEGNAYHWQTTATTELGQALIPTPEPEPIEVPAEPEPIQSEPEPPVVETNEEPKEEPKELVVTVTKPKAPTKPRTTRKSK